MLILFFGILFCLLVITLFRGKRRLYARDDTEVWVEREFERILSRKGYVVFGDLVIPSVSKSIRSTQLDHVVVSPYGIFCLETKSHQGNIYGGSKRSYWKQYMGNKTYDVYNPIKQNNHHVKSLEQLLSPRLKAPIHSYVVFPSARRVKVDGRELDLTLRGTIDRILSHTREVYTLDDVEAISKGLALASSFSDKYMDDHIAAVREYVATKNK